MINYQGREPLKKMIRLMKCYRNNANWKKLVKSQHLKTVVLDMFKIHPEMSWWSDENLSENFVKCLDHLQQSLRNGLLPNFFFHERNVFRKDVEDQTDKRSLEGRGLLINIDVKKLKASFEMENEECKEFWLKSFGEPGKPKINLVRFFLTVLTSHMERLISDQTNRYVNDDIE